jgi:serine/threonine protein kinase/tetratricopeptide (TPR) repeat protein
MDNVEAPQDDRERRLDEAIAQYLQLQTLGETPPRDQWLAQYPDLAEELGEFLDDDIRLRAAFQSDVNETLHRSTEAQSPASRAAAGMCVSDRFRLERKLGEGGMGEVWVARQSKPVKRRVALKLIKAGMDSRAVLHRFEQERQALALMEHPHIARVLDGGITAAGQPFFVMELVNGLPLTAFCDAMKLTLRERLELFVPICQAVQHAHQKGIVHRDLKPANILVTMIDGKPVPKVIDFGVAKATSGQLTEESLSTDFGAVVGTLEYMSPEQAGFSGSDIDTRADIYSLGVILYELLTGLRPIDRKRLRNVALTEMIRIIQEEEPSKPSTRLSTDDSLPSLAAMRQIEPKKLTALLRGELDWVVMKCLEKQRDRRYETANALARDLQRFLADEMVEARPPSAGYRARKFVRRNKQSVLAITLLLLSLLGGVVGTTIGLLRAENALSQEAAQRKQAEQANRQAIQALRAFTDQFMEKQLAAKATLSENEKSILNNALKQWEAFAQAKGDSPQAAALRAEGAVNVAMIQARLGMSSEAEANFRDGIREYESLVKASPDAAEIALDLATSYHNLALLRQAQGDQGDAQRLFQAALAIKSRLASQDPAEPKFQLSLALTHNSMAVLSMQVGDTPTALKLFEESLAIKSGLAAQFPTSAEYREQAASGSHNLGIVRESLGQDRQAEIHYRSAQEIHQKLVDEFPSEPNYKFGLATSCNSLGVLLMRQGHGQESERLLGSAVEIRRQLASEFPSVPEYRFRLADSLHNLAMLRDSQGQFADAESEFRQALQVTESLATEHPANPEYQSHLADAQNALGGFLSGVGRMDEAETLLQRSLATHEKLVAASPETPEYRHKWADDLNRYGLLVEERGIHDAAEELFRRALDLREQLVRENPEILAFRVELGGLHCNLGNTLFSGGRLPEALAAYGRGITVLNDLLANQPDLLVARRYLKNCHANRGVVLGKLGRYAEAAGDWQQAAALAPTEEQPLIRPSLAYARARSGDTTLAVAEVEELTRIPRWPREQWYDFACIYAMASAQITDRAAEFQDRAMQLLAKAVDLGWNDAEHLAADKDLQSLGERQDFQELLRRMRSR